MTLRTFNAEGTGVDGTAVTTANGGGTAFRSVTVPANTFIQYEADAAYKGSMGYRLGSTATGAFYLGTPNDDNVTMRGRVYFRFGALPSGTVQFIQFVNTAGTVPGYIHFGSDGKLSIVPNTGTIQIATNACAANTWYRIEWVIDPGTSATTGYFRLAYYLGESTTAVQTLTFTTMDLLTANMRYINIGKTNSAGTWSGAFWLDELSVDGVATAGASTAFLGPVGGLTVTGAGTASFSGNATGAGNNFAANAKFDTLYENWSAAFDFNKWFLGGTASVTGGKAVLPANGTYIEGLGTNYKFDLTNSSVFAEVVPPASANAEVGMTVHNGDPSVEEIRFLAFSGNLSASYRIAGTSTELWSATHDPVAHKYWRIRHNGTQVLWDTSPDTSTWTQRAAWTPTVSITALTLYFGAGDFDGTFGAAATVDNINVGNAPFPETDIQCYWDASTINVANGAVIPDDWVSSKGEATWLATEYLGSTNAPVKINSSLVDGRPAVRFDGINDNAYANGLLGPNAYSVGMYFNAGANSTLFRCLFSMDSFEIYIDGPNWQVWDGATAHTGPDYIAGTHKVLFTANMSGDWTFSVDGVQIMSGLGGFVPAAGHLEVMSYYGDDRYLAGDLSNVTVWNHVLTSTERTAYFSNWTSAFTTHSGAGVATVVSGATGAGTSPKSGAGTPSARYNATGAGSVIVRGAGTADVSDNATGLGLKVISGSGAGAGFTGSLTAVGAGVVTTSGSGTASGRFNATGNGGSTVGSGGTATASTNGTGAGTTPKSGAGNASAATNATGLGIKVIAGSGAGAGFTGSISGTGGGIVTTSGVGAATALFSGTGASGAAVSAGDGTASTEFNATGEGSALRTGAGTASTSTNAVATSIVQVSGAGAPSARFNATGTTSTQTKASTGNATVALNATGTTSTQVKSGVGPATVVTSATNSVVTVTVRGAGTSSVSTTATGVGINAVAGSGIAGGNFGASGTAAGGATTFGAGDGTISANAEGGGAQVQFGDAFGQCEVDSEGSAKVTTSGSASVSIAADAEGDSGAQVRTGAGSSSVRGSATGTSKIVILSSGVPVSTRTSAASVTGMVAKPGTGAGSFRGFALGGGTRKANDFEYVFADLIEKSVGTADILDNKGTVVLLNATVGTAVLVEALGTVRLETDGVGIATLESKDGRAVLNTGVPHT